VFVVGSVGAGKSLLVLEVTTAPHRNGAAAGFRISRSTDGRDGPTA
jgi:hypothetical protein